MAPPTHPASHSLPPHTLTQLAREWLAEDTPNFDPAGVCVGSGEVEARLLCKTPCSVLAGSPFFTAVFTEVGCTVDWMYQEGAEIGGHHPKHVAPKWVDFPNRFTYTQKHVFGCISFWWFCRVHFSLSHVFTVFISPQPGPGAVTLTAMVRGPARCLLLGERPALNCLARASGIATRCSQLRATAVAAGWQGEVAGTRKTTPGFRLVEKYAMLVGGVSMHRQDLSGMVMLKDNHVWASGSITEVDSCTHGLVLNGSDNGCSHN